MVANPKTASLPEAKALLTMCHKMCHILSMPSVNIRQLRDTRQLFKWLEAGEVVELRKRNRVVARIVPESPRIQPVEWPDFEARARKIFGDRMIPIVDDMIEERNSRY
jgi:antitoxin (DNA-binding transcriptional repressor) of toxin-antitoxin stability system